MKSEAAIGQGDLTVTPLQMARFYAMLANNGVWHQPHIVSRINDKPKAFERYLAAFKLAPSDPPRRAHVAFAVVGLLPDIAASASVIPTPEARRALRHSP